VSSVEVERRGAGLWLRLNRPDALNGINDAVLTEIERGLDAADADDSIRAVVIGAHGRAFCVGADLKAIAAGRGVAGEQLEADSAFRGFLRRVGSTFNRIERSPKPVIAAVQGIAVAGGLELVLCCDLVFAARSASFGDGHANYGLLPGGGGSVRLPRRIGQSRAKYLMFTGSTFPAADFKETDLVTELVGDDELVPRVDAVVEQIARKSALGLARMKVLVTGGSVGAVENALRNELRTLELHEQSDDFAEGLAAFNEKRRPVFTGK
jgi:enoyl-CoA hydratase